MTFDTKTQRIVDDLIRRIRRAERASSSANARVAAVLNAKKHYLRHRLPIHKKLHTKQVQVAKMLERIRTMLGNSNIQVASSSKNGSRRTLMRLSQYERVKLFALLKGDFRGVFRCSAAEERVLRSIITERLNGL